MSDREELAELILSEFRPPKESGQSWRLSPFTAADKILAAGYRKPRTITTEEELDALPLGAVILDSDPAVLQMLERSAIAGAEWAMPNEEYLYASGEVTLPATVLWEPLP